jgi:pimeloyl-ACP methyl ester carboxylesterase
MVAPLVELTPSNDYTGYRLTMHLHDVAGVQVGLERLGDEGDRPVLHLHGFPVDHVGLEVPLERMYASRPGWRRVHVDLPGFGIAPPSDAVGSSDDALRVVLALVDELADNGPVALVGMSWGGYLAHAAAVRRREAVAGLALICPMTVPDHDARDLPDVPPVQVPLEVAAGMDAADLAEFRDVAVVADARHAAFFRDAVLPGLRGADPGAVERIGARYALTDDTAHAPFDGPVVIVTGRQDGITGYRDAWRFAETLPHATFAVLDAAGHHLHVEREAATAALLGDWLDAVGALA